MNDISDRVQRELLSWSGVTVHDHRFGGIEFRVNGREMGHMHGDRLADLPFPMNIRNELVAKGRAQPHHVLPQSGYVSYWIRGIEDVPAVIELFRMQYDRIALKKHTQL